jgi:hypothetical protein
LLSPEGLGEREKGFVSGHLPGVLPGYRRELQFIATILPSGKGGRQTYSVTDEKKEEKQVDNGHEEFRLLGYDAMYSVESQPTFRRNMSPSSSGLKNKPCKKLA